MSTDNLDTAKFTDSLAHGVPVLVTGLQRRFQGTWNPQRFAEKYGSEQITLINCETELEFKSTVADFFRDFDVPRDRKQIVKLKVSCVMMTLPPGRTVTKGFVRTGLRNIISDRFFPTFMRLSSMPYRFPIIRARMVCAILCHTLHRMELYLTWVCVSLLYFHLSHHSFVIPGPKMYNAHGDPANNLRHGSTRLHLDVTGAVNIMLYAADQLDGSPGGALWHIFGPEATPILRQFMREEAAGATEEPGDPIHNQSTYLTPSLLETLSQRYGLHPYTISQHPGDAVYIPAGCAHQVCSVLFFRVRAIITNRSATYQVLLRLRATFSVLKASLPADNLLISSVSKGWYTGGRKTYFSSKQPFGMRGMPCRSSVPIYSTSNHSS